MALEMRKEIEKGIEKIIHEHGALLVSMDWQKEKDGEVLSVAADTLEGITIDVLSRITQAVLPLLEEHPELAESVRLEVSSPGLDNTLRFPWQFNRHKGYEMQVVYADGAVETSIEAVCEGENEGVVSLSKGGRTLEIPFANIRSALVRASLKSKKV